MKTSPHSMENENISCKSKARLILSALMMLLCVAMIITSLPACSSKNSTTATADEAVTSVTVENEEAYIFAEGIFFGSANVGNKSYKEAREIAKNELSAKMNDFTLTVKAKDNTYEYTQADFSYTDNIETVLHDAAIFTENATDSEKTEGKTFELEFTVEASSVESKVEEIAAEVYLEPVNATLKEEQSTVTVSESAVGYELDKDALVQAMTKEVISLTKGEKAKSAITATVNEIQPSLSYDDLDGKITLLSSFTTVSTNTADGNHNMALALSSCNGSVIGPGETWSFNACTGNSNLTSLGYRSATVIIGGELVPGIGGGLCQSSTTIYNAAIRTNMEIVERYCHYYQSTYADAGLDATIDYPNLDLKLKNPTDYPMYLQCYMSGKTLYCNIYGYQDPSFDEVKVSSYIYEANRANNYYKAAATRTFYKDGKVVLEEKLPNSTYHYTSPNATTTATETTVPETTAPATAKPTKPTTATQPTASPKTDPVETTPTEPATTPTQPQDPTEAVTDTAETTPVEY